MKIHFTYAVFFLMTFFKSQTSAQHTYGSKPVTWQFSHTWVGPGTASWGATAVLAPGWHLYSQHLEDSGPLPTCITFQQEDTYTLLGTTIEEGEAMSTYDSVYEASITWYKHRVRFSQRIRLQAPEVTIRGTIEYMVCNRSSCVPDRVTFTHTITQ